uniref:Uncharacterized protein n=1 Tax=Anguilla anguilla TaxID=7936 RepID=A0A0E9Q460_ANGAN
MGLEVHCTSLIYCGHCYTFAVMFLY